LRYVVEHNLKNSDCRLTSLDIAIDCFKRSPKDPNDAYVRNIASQTRKSLASFYNDRSTEKTLEIQIPIGGYKPEYVYLAEQELSPSDNKLIGPAEPNLFPYKPVLVDSDKGAGQLKVTVAIIPFACRSGSKDDAAIGHLIADEVNSQLAASRLITVIAQRSATTFCNKDTGTLDITRLLNADYVLTGSFYVHRDTIRVHVALNNNEDEAQLWGKVISCQAGALIDGTDSLIDELLQGISLSIMQNEVSRALTQPLTSLKCHSLLIGGITCMHRASPSEFALAGEMFNSLKERNPRHAVGFAYRARWSLFRLYRGNGSSLPNSEIRQHVEQQTIEALEKDSMHPIALAAQGLIKSHFEGNMEAAQSIYEHALYQAPNEPTALGLLSVVQTYSDNPEEASKSAQEAMRVSPFDPEMYFLETAAAMAAFSKKDYETAIEFGERSRLRIPSHTSNLRALTASYYGLGKLDLAERTAKQLLQVDPDFTLDKYQRSSTFTHFEVGKRMTEFLNRAGIPFS